MRTSRTDAHATWHKYKELGLEAIQNSHEAAEERMHTWFHPDLPARSSCDFYNPGKVIIAVTSSFVVSGVPGT